MKKLLHGLMVVALLFVYSCSGSSAPSTPDTTTSPEAYSRTIDGSIGGLVTWNNLNLKFPANPDLGVFTVLIEPGDQDYLEGIVSLAGPYQVTLDGITGDELPEGYQFEAWFELEEIIGTEIAPHEYIDIQKTLGLGLTSSQTLYSWAKIDDGRLYCPVMETSVVLGPIDYSGMPDLNFSAMLTDDAGQVAALHRNAQVTSFGPANRGPINDRIPIILIQGLNIYQPETAPFKLQDTSGNWNDFIAVLNAYPEYYHYFKFFWFAYPSHKFVVGYANGGVTLYNEIWNWANTRDHAIVERPVVLFGGSMGGLMGRDYYQNYNDPEVFKLVTIATPHYGTPIVNILMDRWSKNDLQGTSFLNTKGIVGLRCRQAIKYQWGIYTPTTRAYNWCPIALLNNSLTFEKKRNIIMLGGSYNVPPAIDDDILFGCNLLLQCVIEPLWLREYRYGYHSDGVVPWSSQLMRKYGPPPEETLYPDLHSVLLENPELLAKLWWVFLDIYETYP